METLVKEIYAKMTYSKIKSVLVALSSMAVFTVLISLFEGNPFPTYESDGWILEKTYLWIAVALLSILYNWMWQLRLFQRMYRPFIELLNEQCDPQSLREAARYGMDYGMSLTGRGARSAFYYFEQNYILALNALGEFEEAILYLEALWQSKQKLRMRDYLLRLIQLNDAAEKKDKVRYFELCEKIPPRLRKNPTWLAQLARMQGKYEAAIEILEHTVVKRQLEKVAVQAGLAECYLELGNAEKAKEHFQYVIEHGNTTLYRRKALEMMKKMEE